MAGTRAREVQGKAKTPGHFTCENSLDPGKPRVGTLESKKLRYRGVYYLIPGQLANVGDKVTQAGSQVSNVGEMVLP